MPNNQFQKMFYAFVTVLITVHGYVFYSIYVVNGHFIMEMNQTNSVLAGVAKQGGIMVLGQNISILGVILIEFCFAFTIEILVGSPLSFRLARGKMDPGKCNPMLFEIAIICFTVCIMCPLMSFVAAWMYYPYALGFHLLTLLADWLKLVCINFPFAIFTQIFLIQPVVRRIFSFVFQEKNLEKATDLI